MHCEDVHVFPSFRKPVRCYITVYLRYVRTTVRTTHVLYVDVSSVFGQQSAHLHIVLACSDMQCSVTMILQKVGCNHIN